MSEPKDVFDAVPISVERVMMEPGRGFYIPSYQRPFAWGVDDVGALLTSISEGMVALHEMEDAITFIGTFIFVHDTQYRTVEPQVRNELPQGVFLVIDGQQRLTTLSLIAICLHDALRRADARVTKQGVAIPWLEGLRIEIANRLEQVIYIDKLYGDGHLQYYPRIVRAHDDSWSRRATEANYVSPTASLLDAYIQAVKAGEDKKPRGAFKWQPSPPSSEREAEYKLVEKCMRHVTSHLQKLANAEAAADDESLPDLVPNLAGLADSVELQQRYFKHAAPAEAITHWKDKSDPNNNVNQLCRLLLFGRYLLERVAVTQVLVKREEYAFDLFEALNTTGEPLTAYETFKPIVIKTEKLENYKASPSAAHLDKIEAFLSRYAGDRRKASDRLLIPFALVEKGYKLGRHLRDQRNWLRRNYDESGLGLDAKREFLRGMAGVAQFLSRIWDEEDAAQLEVHLAELGLATADRRDVKLCARVLVDSKHEITVPLLARFYERLLTAPSSSKQEAAFDFASAFRSATSFFAFWRGSRIGTENIDRVYRDLMSKPIDGLGPFRRDQGTTPKATDLQQILRAKLVEKGIDKAAQWIDKAAPIPVYQQSRELTKLLLLAAAHDEIPDDSRPGHTKPGKPDACPMLTLEHWNHDLEIEHVAPKKPSAPGSWPEEIYSKELVHVLGNLLLLPPDSNRSAGNKNWLAKSLYYRVIASDDPNATAKLLESAASQGVELSQPTQDLLARARYLPHLRAIAQLPGDWHAQQIDHRSRELAEKAWNRLAPWLGLEQLSSCASG